LAIGVAKAVIF